MHLNSYHCENSVLYLFVTQFQNKDSYTTIYVYLACYTVLSSCSSLDD